MGLSYYRLRQTDYDGTTEVFPAVNVLVSGDDGFSVYPNPLKGQTFQLKASGKKSNEMLTLNIYNLQGRLIFSRAVTADHFGYVQSDIDLGFAPDKGTYIAELISGNEKLMQKIQAGF